MEWGGGFWGLQSWWEPGRWCWLVLGEFAPTHEEATWMQAICSRLVSQEVISLWRCLAEISAVPRFCCKACLQPACRTHLSALGGWPRARVASLPLIEVKGAQKNAFGLAMVLGTFAATSLPSIRLPQAFVTHNFLKTFLKHFLIVGTH